MFKSMQVEAKRVRPGDGIWIEGKVAVVDRWKLLEEEQQAGITVVLADDIYATLHFGLNEVVDIVREISEGVMHG